jgi:putative DNA primase/helicase
LFHFAGGVYRSRAEQFIKKRVKALMIEWDMAKQWTTHRTNEVVEYVRVDSPRLWDRPPLDTINVQNGLVDVKTRSLRSHDPAFLSAVQLSVNYDPRATCPATERFVTDVYPDDAHAIAWQLRAWLMLPYMSLQQAVLLLGEGANGKSTELAAITAFIGQRNIAGISLHKIETDRFAAARLVGKLANICPDLPSEHLSSTSVFKALTGGDIIVAERKFQDSFEFQPFARLVFSANHPPRSADASHAFFRRWVVVPFDRTFDPDEQVPRAELDARLADPAELSGVLNKAMDALTALLADGFTDTPSITAAWSEFRQTTDPLTAWLERETVPGADNFVLKIDLRGAYNRQADQAARPPVTPHAMTKAVRRVYPDLRHGQRTINGRVQDCWIGLGLAAKDHG